jgi:molecular chaperone GrpE
MPTRKHAKGDDATDDASGDVAATVGAETDGAAQADAEDEDISVIWRKKQAPVPAATAEPAAEREDSSQLEGDWAERFKAEQAKADDYFAKWQRAAADMANMRRRHEQDRIEFAKQANALLIEDLLPVLDSFDRALATMPPELRELTWVDGVVLVERQLRAVLQRAGLNPIEAQGKPFDPTEHEALMHEASEEPEDTVIGELQRGYKLHDRVLRPAMVKVAKT